MSGVVLQPAQHITGHFWRQILWANSCIVTTDNHKRITQNLAQEAKHKTSKLVVDKKNMQNVQSSVNESVIVYLILWLSVVLLDIQGGA